MNKPRPSDDAAKTFNAYDPSNSIRFDEPRKLPVRMIAIAIGGFLLVCGIAFAVLYKVNVGAPPPPVAPRGSLLGVPPPPQAREDGSLPPPVARKSQDAASGIAGATTDEDGNIVISKPESQCTFLKVHMKNLDEMVGDNPDAVQWIADKRNTARQRMAMLGC
ncbi:MAG: hypothetical protein V4562_09985 [Pseudomonadota bacterium]